MSDKPKNLDDIDNFWDLNSLLPKKRPVNPIHRAPNTGTVEITVGEDSTEKNAGSPIPPRSDTNTISYHVVNGARIIVREAAKKASDIEILDRAEQGLRRLRDVTVGQPATLQTRAEQYRSRPLDPYLIYTPEGSIIKRVEVARWDTKFNFYENFRTDAKRLWSRGAAECEHVPFFAYVPQYSQLKYTQLKWYLWWRENVRQGVYLKCDFCYILLYIYEILNCPDLIAPEAGVQLLCDIWLNYRGDHRRIDSYLSDWLADYCLIHKRPCPIARLEPLLGDIVAVASFKEFYMASAKSAAAEILSHTSTYDWRSSRYLTSENISIFAEHIRGAFDKVWREILSADSTTKSNTVKELRVERTAYEGALCAYDMKRTVTVEYVSYTRSPKLRFVVTDIIKYSENRVRMALGIKSRLKVTELTDDMRRCIDEYFEAHLPAPKKTRTSRGDTENASSEYDKLYEPTSTKLSIENAIEIEKASWSTTEILTSAFEESAKVDEAVPETPISHTDFTPPVAAVSDNVDEFAAFVDSLDTASREALTLVANGDARGITAVAARSGTLADALADKINECAFDIIGDSIIEPYSTGYRLIEDYEGDIKKWLK